MSRVSQSDLEARRDRINEYFPEARISFYDTGKREYNRAIFEYTFTHNRAGIQTRLWNLTQISDHMNETWEIVPELRVFGVDNDLRDAVALLQEKEKECDALREQIAALRNEKEELDAKLAEMSE